MVEVPAAAIMHRPPAAALRLRLVRYQRPDPVHLAIDRADEAVAHLYDPWHPAVLQLLSHDDRAITLGRALGQRLRRNGRRPLFTELLLAMGLRSFSMHPARISSIKQRILRADVGRLEARREAVLASSDPAAAAAAMLRTSPN
jgi:phosphoenolpyruvate-protein phosphotransferase (PTS system enzyme I)